MNKVLIILPAFNEGKVIGKVITSVRKEGFKNILVVDDSSKDNTSETAEKAGAIVLRHSINRGAGATTLTGLTYARLKNYDFAVTMDSDGQHNPKEIKKLLNKSRKYDVVIGSRMINSEGMPLHRRIANNIGSLLTWFFFGLFVKDSQSGFKIFNKKALDKITITFDRYEFCSEVIGEIHKHKLSFVEVPIHVIYTSHSQSKGQSIKNCFIMILRFIYRKLLKS